MQSRRELEERFGIADRLRFEETENGLVRASITTAEAEADVYLQGAHLAHWRPKGERPVLFVSSRSEFVPGRAIRGGVPIIFPWFGPRGGGMDGPSHGFARTAVWRVETAREIEGKVELVFALEPKDVADVVGYADFRLQFKAVIGRELEMELQVRHDGAMPMQFEDALHSYFAVGDIHQISVSGLEGTTYIDKTDNLARKLAEEKSIRFTRETDQVHLNTTATCLIDDSLWRRRIVVEKSGSKSTVVWNPWAERAAALKDIGPGEWSGMVCVESANAADNAVTLERGQDHLMRTVISVE